MKEVITNNVAVLRTKKKLTQEDLAKAISVSRQTIIAIEKGNYTPSIMLALKIAMYFSVPVERVFRITYE